MEYTIEIIKLAMHQMLDSIYPDLDILLLGHFTEEDVINQAIMEYIIKDYQINSKRESIRQHRINHGMATDINDAAYAQRYTRIIKKVEHYKNINRSDLLSSTGVERIDLTYNPKDGSSSWKNPYKLNEVDFRELTALDKCILFSKIFEHKISSKTSVPNPMFQDLFATYESLVNSLFNDMDSKDPSTVIKRTAEYFSIQWKYCIDFFYQITLEAEKRNYPKSLPYQRIAPLCARISQIPATPWMKISVKAVECRMLMKRADYCKDLYALSDDEWEQQLCLILEAYRLKEVLCQAKHGTAFLGPISRIASEEKAQFIKDNYWIWNQRVHFDWGNRKRIQCMRDLYENLTQKMPNAQNS